MLGIGYPSLSMEESDLLSIELLLRSPICIACSKNRWPTKRNRPALSDFRDDNFLAFSEFAADYVDMVRKVCRRDAGFEPTLLPVADSFESLISMVAAGRGVFLCPEALRDRAVGVNFQVLGGSKGEFEEPPRETPVFPGRYTFSHTLRHSPILRVWWGDGFPTTVPGFALLVRCFHRS
jgi:DNA-binding transcriptional LysR family regulator